MTLIQFSSIPSDFICLFPESEDQLLFLQWSFTADYLQIWYLTSPASQYFIIYNSEKKNPLKTIMVSLFTVMAHQIIFRTITKFQFDLYGSCEANLQFLFILSEWESEGRWWRKTKWIMIVPSPVSYVASTPPLSSTNTVSSGRMNSISTTQSQFGTV